MKIAIPSLIVTTAILLQGCGFYYSKQAPLAGLDGSNSITGTSNTASGSGTVGVSFADVQKSLFNPSCVQCHSAGNSSGGVALDTYANVVAHLQAVNQAVLSGIMPPSGNLGTSQVQLLAEWIAQGAPQVAQVLSSNTTPSSVVPAPTIQPVPIATPGTSTPTPVPGGAPSTLVATFSSIKTNIFVPKCTSCHGAGGSQSSRPLDNYTTMMASGIIVAGNPASSQAFTAMQSGVMPPGGNAVTSQELTVIQQWIQNGALNN